MKIKNLNFKALIKSTVFAVAASSLLFTACNEEDGDVVAPDMPKGMLTVSDQTISQNTIIVSNVNLDQDGWIVVHASENEGPVVPNIISEPVFVEAGDANDISVPLTDFSSFSGETEVWVMLHTDNGEAGVYEFDGANGLDAPITVTEDDNDGDGEEETEIVMDNINISAPSITVSNQAVSENMVVIEEVNAAADGWIVIHEGEASGPVIGQTYVEAGVNNNVMIDLGNATFSGGEMLFPMLHIESPADGEYGFPDNGDGPEVFGNDVIVVGFETEAPKGTITVEDQPVDANTIVVSDLTVNATAWVVVHADNNGSPVVPGIISEPVQLMEGSNQNVEITLTERTAAGDVLYVMIHTENGVIGEYEFDGDNGFDNPVNTATMTVEAPTGSITAENQIIQGNIITVQDLTVNATSWVVVHADNNGNPVVPGIISTPVQLQPGSNSNVEIELTETVNGGEVIYIMIHTENGTIGEYEFDGVSGLDGPVVTQPITIQAPTGRFDANDQALSAENTITVESITVGQPSWVVVHRDNGMGSFVAPGIISEPVALEEGTSTNVEIPFADGETVADGETLWIMLHNDNGVVGSYEFDADNGLDNPISFSSIVVSEANVTNYDVTNDGASSYLLSGNGLTNSSNPNITLVRGETYTFTVNASGHPFYINATQGTGTANAYNNGVSNNGAQSGTVTFTVPLDAPGTLFYNCQFHSSMTGTITITD
ncbi:cupredoxin domain-containing protein [Marivirga sp.]|uniref:cupredoxin domain-containing protein n=1 Tax=Marivirga sp. TaxID=2018662 RepID=UPI002D7E84B9|nr:hypothetical protein [Marivirga sp.]HET8860852.1 hypothetical protein [Marivirga sp.]